jgi:hypothetical protein
MTHDEEQIWRYILENRQATSEEVALKCNVDTEFASDLMARIGTENWREQVAPMWGDDKSVSDYTPLRAVLDAAYNQSAHGKGKVRHANAKPFTQQPIMEIGRMVGVGYQLGQAMKKAQEAGGMAQRGELEAARAELLGAIVYLSAAHVLIGEQQ